MPTVTILQHEAGVPLGTLAGALDDAGIRPQFVRIYDDEPVPADPSGAGGLIVLGGTMAAYEQDRHPHLADSIRLLRRAWEGGTPILGICLGSQLLAAALGAPVALSPRPEIGWHPVALTEAAAADPLWAGVASPQVVLQWHGDRHGLPAGAVRLAWSERADTQAFRAGPHAYGLQFHLEGTRPMIDDWLSPFTQPVGDGVQSPTEILAGTDAHLPDMQSLAALVFGRWARLVA